jgi:hypothetical protein
MTKLIKFTQVDQHGYADIAYINPDNVCYIKDAKHRTQVYMTGGNFITVDTPSRIVAEMLQAEKEE